MAFGCLLECLKGCPPKSCLLLVAAGGAVAINQGYAKVVCASCGVPEAVVRSYDVND